MKRRHLEALGLRVINVSYWNYRPDLPEERRVALLRNYLQSVADGL
jgi:hypothetical protein